MRNDMLFIGDKLMDLDDDTKVTLNFKSNIFCSTICAKG